LRGISFPEVTIDREATEKLSLAELRDSITTNADKILLMELINELSDTEWQEILNAAKTDRQLLAFLALWPRFWKRSHQKAFFRFLEETRPERMEGGLPFPMMSMSPGEYPIILPHMIVQQMTYGCSQACSFCDVAAPYPRVDGRDSLEHLPYGQIRNLAETYALFNIELVDGLMSYWASDPFEHPQIEAITNLIGDKLKQLPNFVSHAPKAGMAAMARLIKSGTIHLRLSATSRNIERINTLLREIFGEDVDHMEPTGEFDPFPGPFPNRLPADNSKDFSVSLSYGGKPTRRHQPKKKTLGTSVKKGEHANDDPAFGCQSGVMLTPLGLYSKLHKVGVSRENPFGDIVVPLGTLQPIDSEAQIRGITVEELLSKVVTVGSYQRTKTPNTTFTFKVIDANKETWNIVARSESGQWVVAAARKWS
jgi:hypothetical protein